MNTNKIAQEINKLSKSVIGAGPESFFQDLYDKFYTEVELHVNRIYLKEMKRLFPYITNINMEMNNSTLYLTFVVDGGSVVELSEYLRKKGVYSNVRIDEKRLNRGTVKAALYVR